MLEQFKSWLITKFHRIKHIGSILIRQCIFVILFNNNKIFFRKQIIETHTCALTWLTKHGFDNPDKNKCVKHL